MQHKYNIACASRLSPKYARVALKRLPLLFNVRYVDGRYNWSPGILESSAADAQALAGCEYIPMLWGKKDFTEERLASLSVIGQSSHLLGFNEPNFGDQVHSRQYYTAQWARLKPF